MIRLGIVLAIILIIGSLFFALFAFMKDAGNRSTRSVKALSIRIALSVALLSFIVLALSMGWVTPNVGY